MKKLFTPKKLVIYRLIGICAVFFFLIFNFILVLNSDRGNYTNLTGGGKLSIYFAFFTTQSNYIVFFYFCLSLAMYGFKQSKPHFLIRLGVTVYISMTMLVFGTGLATQGEILTGFNTYDGIATAVLHLIIPIAMIITFFATCGESYYNYQNHHKGNFGLISFYPFIYLLCVLIRGIIRYHDHALDPSLSDMYFPYFFLDIYAESGVEMISAGVVLVFVLCTIFQYFYIGINNLFFYHTTAGKATNYQLRIYRKKYKSISIMRLDKKERAGAITAIVVALLNIVFSIIFFVLRDFGSEFLKNSYNSNIVLVFCFVIICFSVIIIVLAILMLNRFYWAKITLGILSVALIAFNGIGIIGPILDVVVVFCCLGSKTLTEADIIKLTHFKTSINKKNK